MCKPPSLALKSFFKLKYINVEKKRKEKKINFKSYTEPWDFSYLKETKYILLIYIHIYITQLPDTHLENSSFAY